MTSTAVRLGCRRLGDYARAAGPAEIEMLRRRAAPFAGSRVLHLSAGPFGSAVAETLAGLVPLQRDLGLQAEWRVLRGDHPAVWQAVYDGTAGAGVRWTAKERTAWYTDTARLMASIATQYDIVVAHDPQAVALSLARRKADRARWIWHCHLDPRSADPGVWADLQHACRTYSAVLFPTVETIRPDCAAPYRGTARPAIDPAAPRNLSLPAEFGQILIRRLGLDPRRPLIGQFGPIDRRFAPIAALGTYWLARRAIPGLQIVLADASLTGHSSRTDAEEVLEAAAGDPDIHVLTAEQDLGPTTINALQRQVDVALQMVVPAGFGWGAAECQVKGKPVIVGEHGLLPGQIAGGRAGVVVEGAPDAAETVIRWIRDPGEASRLGRAGQEHILRRHLLTGLAADYFETFEAILGRGQAPIGGRRVAEPLAGTVAG